MRRKAEPTEDRLKSLSGGGKERTQFKMNGMPGNSPKRQMKWLRLKDCDTLRPWTVAHWTCWGETKHLALVFRHKESTDVVIPYIIQLGAQFCLIYLFISFLYMFRASMCPSSGENCCIYATLVFVILCGWRLVGRLDWIQPEDQMPSIHNGKYQCRKDTIIFSWWWTHGCPKHVDKGNK